MGRLERSVYLVALLGLAGLCLLLLVRSNQALRLQADAEAQLQVQLSKAQAEILALQEQQVELRGQLLAQRREHAPPAGLAAALKERRDLIPFPGVLGGTMQFDQPESWIATPHWVIAHFSDGHIGGAILLQYRRENEQFQWSVLDARLD